MNFQKIQKLKVDLLKDLAQGETTVRLDDRPGLTATSMCGKVYIVEDGVVYNDEDYFAIVQNALKKHSDYLLSTATPS